VAFKLFVHTELDAQEKFHPKKTSSKISALADNLCRCIKDVLRGCNLAALAGQ